jgi:predicted adenine nucleotide alpha hydrolase (AANH) superfamily ATPase
MRILLHICCGVCAGSVAEKLMVDGHKVTGFFYNPCIHPKDEYQRRLEVARKIALDMGFDLGEGPYDRETWFELVKGREYDPEGGARCRICFDMRLRRTFEYFREKGVFDLFATTLSVSPHKDAEVINSAGRAIGGDKYMISDFKRKGGFQRAMEIAKEHGLYRQDYCGCIYSLEEAIKRKEQSA